MAQGSDYNPYRAPSSDLAQDAGGPPADDGTLASRGARLLASIVDGLISGVLFLPLQFLFGVFDGFPRIKPLSPVQTALWGLAGIVVFLALHGYLLAKNGQTIGKRLLGIRIANVVDGQLPPLAKIIFLRVLPVQALALVPVVGPLAALVDALLIFRGDHRCAHDHIAGTVVLKV